MSVSAARIRTLQALVAASPACSRSTTVLHINKEIQALDNARHAMPTARRWLLEVLHCTRALDSTLSAVIMHYHCPCLGNSLGKSLRALERHSLPTLARLAPGRAGHYQVTLVGHRNRYMHSANAYPPNSREADRIVGEMHSCLAEVLALE